MVEFTHIQASPSTNWAINHGLDDYPATDVVVIASGNREKILPSMVEYIDSDNVVVRFSSPETGSVRLVGRGTGYKIALNNDRSDSVSLPPPPFELRSTQASMEYWTEYNAPGAAAAYGGSWDTLTAPAQATFSSNDELSFTASAECAVRITEARSGSSGRYACEWKIGNVPAGATLFIGVFIQAYGPPFNPDVEYGGPLGSSYTQAGNVVGFGSGASGLATWGADDVMGVVVDFDSNSVHFGVQFFKNGLLITTGTMSNNVNVTPMVGIVA